MSELIETGVRNGVLTLRFNRPQKKNAITRPMYTALADAMAAGEATDDVGAHLFLGAPGTFTAGNDLADFLARDGHPSPDAPVQAFLETVVGARKPLIAAVDGLAIGIGTTLLLHCDLVYASPAAKLSTPFIDLGLVPEAASSLLLPERCGHAVAFELLCLGATFGAERALRAGLVNEIVPADLLEAHATEAAERLARKPRRALMLSRGLLRGDGKRVRTRMREEFAHFSERLQSAEAREAFAAFLEKRPPVFKKPAAS